jgi:hypothetical protein
MLKVSLEEQQLCWLKSIVSYFWKKNMTLAILMLHKWSIQAMNILIYNHVTKKRKKKKHVTQKCDREQQINQNVEKHLLKRQALKNN